MEQIDFSIIVCTYNRATMLHNALKCLIHQNIGGELSYEIVVIDDGSTDETRHIVEEVANYSQATIKYVQGEGKGYSNALNLGVAESQGEWLALFDDDELADADWLKELFTVAVNEHVQLVGGRVMLAMPEGELSMLGPVIRALCGEHPTYWETLRRHYKPLPGGGNLLVKRTVFDSIGGLDETMLTGGCDRDLVLRARAAGFDIGWAPKAVVRHVVPSHRIKPNYIRWYSLQVGCGFSYINWKQRRHWIMLLAFIARIGQALLVNSPLLFLGYLRRSRTEILDRKALLWRAVGYSRKTLSLFVPRLFPQRRFFARFEFRKERETFSKESSGPEK